MGLTTMRTLFTCFFNWELRREQEGYGSAYTTHPFIRQQVLVVTPMLFGMPFRQAPRTLSFP